MSFHKFFTESLAIHKSPDIFFHFSFFFFFFNNKKDNSKTLRRYITLSYVTCQNIFKYMPKLEWSCSILIWASFCSVRTLMFLSYPGCKTMLFTLVSKYDRFQPNLILQWMFISHWWSPPHLMVCKEKHREASEDSL